jgi:hypothetical protein
MRETASAFLEEIYVNDSEITFALFYKDNYFCSAMKSVDAEGHRKFNCFLNQ